MLGTKENPLWLLTVSTLGNHNFHNLIVSLSPLGLLKKTDNDFNRFTLGYSRILQCNCYNDISGNCKHQLWNCIVFRLVYNKQLLDEVQHDIMNYQSRGLFYLPKPKAEADNTDARV